MTTLSQDVERAVLRESERDLIRQMVPGATCSFVRDASGWLQPDPLDTAMLDMEQPFSAILHPGHAETIDALCFHTERSGSPKSARLSIPRETTMRMLSVTAVPVVSDTTGDLVAVMCRGEVQRSIAALEYENRFTEADFARALDNEEFTLHYQPIHDIRTGVVAGAEALLRWDHPEQGMVPPLRFIREAERTGDIIEIGHWVMLEACLEASTWPDEDLTIAVNVSGHQVRAGSLLQTVRTALSISGIDPRRLTIELTETQLINEKTAVLSLIGHLRSLGVRVAIDDFGAGYSNLARLQLHRGNIVKIDPSLIRAVVDDEDMRHVLEALVGLVKAVGCDAIAEGVSRPEELAVIKTMGLDYSQGYLHAHPMSGQAFVDYLGSMCDMLEPSGGVPLA